MNRNVTRLHMPLVVLVLLASLVATGGPAFASQITFRVDMSVQSGYGLFDAGSDLVVARGTFNGWAGNAAVLSDADENDVHEITIDLAPGSYEYKYVIVPPGGPDRWEDSIGNRTITVAGDALLDVVWFDDDDRVPVPPQDTEILFSVDMSLEMAKGRFVHGSDQVAVRGDHSVLGDWTGTGVVLERQSSSSVYSAWVQFDELPGYPLRHKFVIRNGGDPGDLLWENHIEDRSLQIAGDESDDLPPPGGNGYAELELPVAMFDHGAGWVPHETVVGADLSFLPRLTSLGAEFSVNGTPDDALDIFAGHGYNLVRLRLWHTPGEPWHGLDETVAHALDVKAAGHALMLDIHYSDTWADPAHQIKPAAWSTLSHAALVDSVYDYTNAVIRRFRDEGVLPEYVQIGNEISVGMLWDNGRVGGAWDTPQQWSQLAGLLNAGVDAVRDSLPEAEWPKIVVHVDNGGSNGLCRWFYDNLVEEQVSFDVIGVSFYPWWHGTLEDLRANLDDLAGRFGRDLMVVETAYPWTLDGNDGTGNFVDSVDDLLPGYDATPSGQRLFLEELLAVVDGVPGGLGAGIVYWEPDYLTVPGGPGNPYENLTLFDFDGDALPGLGFSTPWGTSVPDCDPDVGEGQGAVPSLRPARPNPFGASTSLACEIPGEGAHVTARVFDASGREVAVIADEFMEGGSHRLAWDGEDRNGRRVASGVYLFLLESSERSAFSKVVLVR